MPGAPAHEVRAHRHGAEHAAPVHLEGAERGQRAGGAVLAGDHEVALVEGPQDLEPPVGPVGRHPLVELRGVPGPGQAVPAGVVGKGAQVDLHVEVRVGAAVVPAFEEAHEGGLCAGGTPGHKK